MKIIQEPKKFQRLCQKWRSQGHSVSLVPTMGFYHKGHIHLMREACRHGGKVAVSLFVNPTQFGPTEDFSTYPRDFERDAKIARKAGVDVLFAPLAEAMFLPLSSTWVEVPALAHVMCGASRPIHFRGVCTVVMKLLMLSQATDVFFGQKDWQQVAIIKRMVADLNVPVKIHPCKTIREKDGLACSSRNTYLSPEERNLAPHIYAALRKAAESVSNGERSVAAILQLVRAYWEKNIPHAKEDYLVIVHPDTLVPMEERIDEAALCAVATKVGTTRLIDNILLNP